jgi:hypothetical protein
MAAPALTYARPYALFTLVGIAGEEISTPPISMPAPSQQWICRALTVATNRMGNLG